MEAAVADTVVAFLALDSVGERRQIVKIDGFSKHSVNITALNDFAINYAFKIIR